MKKYSIISHFTIYECTNSCNNFHIKHNKAFMIMAENKQDAENKARACILTEDNRPECSESSYARLHVFVENIE